MAQILVRNLDDEVVDRLKARALRHKRSLQAEVKFILEKAVKLDRAAARDIADLFRRRTAGRQMGDSAEVIREFRDGSEEDAGERRQQALDCIRQDLDEGQGRTLSPTPDEIVRQDRER